MKKLLIIGFVWPEPSSTAAGTRMLQLIELFQKNNFNITFACSAAKTTNSFNLESLNIECKEITLNCNSFDKFIKNLQPNYVLFDRFLTEEQFGWRVSEVCPETIRILDTEDLHFLRKSRELALKDNKTDFLEYLHNDITIREIASIYRCDLTLIISKYEKTLLTKFFNINKSLLIYIPFLLESLKLEKLRSYPTFTNRKNFVSIGNFKHKPNWNAVLNLKQHIWPIIKEKLPNSELHIYGAYCTEKVFQLNNNSEGFIVKGWAKDIENVFKHSRVCLAPLEFGAGLKGKLINSMEFGTPNVTTSIGAESMHGNLNWNGFICNDNETFSLKAVELYSSSKIWEEFQNNGVKIINKCYSKKKFETKLLTKIKVIENNLKLHRKMNFIGCMLSHHTLKSTKYMSKWIEEKNKIN